ncbi:hypothetical protein ASPVEDRAFT_589150 [Aspergillus versicolor CBS 583.65]|uniref:Uncharacterized protein n=1 Tax=Aspergillus versicolor CBS 583.65 TaxID=1036611 RepID=A0A1L9PGS6_ASPVE|nr:uncharacterized protein ASPVEDRAFT_589150 [Aspergillus versicolor CBS 583.65]OJJ00718.1 hypothetical protein ASPVEDRAFT_589150 [Aspergillus versicolor CBS 583.65]
MCGYLRGSYHENGPWIRVTCSLPVSLLGIYDVWSYLVGRIITGVTARADVEFGESRYHE